ncbi:MAG: hypothetical protein ABW098_12765 [Candidatus Thiodiazotropha sp.]
MEKKRYIDQREHRYTTSEPTTTGPTLIVCPKCSKKASVIFSDTQPDLGYTVKATCLNCGFSHEKTATARAFYWAEGEPSDGYFDYRLWLKIPCCGHTLWAFNLRHLRFLEDFVSAELRENPKDDLGYANSSMSSRLPKWIKASKNRKQVLSCIQKLKQLVNSA